jgi:hypothetical protein
MSYWSVDSFGWRAYHLRMFHDELEAGFQLIGEFVGIVPAMKQMMQRAE